VYSLTLSPSKEAMPDLDSINVHIRGMNQTATPKRIMAMRTVLVLGIYY